MPPVSMQQPTLLTTMQPQQNSSQSGANVLASQQAPQLSQQAPAPTTPVSGQGVAGSQITPSLRHSGPMPPPQAAQFAPNIPMSSQPIQQAPVPPQLEQKPPQQQYVQQPVQALNGSHIGQNFVPSSVQQQLGGQPVTSQLSNGIPQLVQAQQASQPVRFATVYGL